MPIKRLYIYGKGLNPYTEITYGNNILCLLTLIFILGNISITNIAKGQTPKLKKQKAEKGKPVIYNAFGMGVLPHEHKMAGGNHIAYRKFGYGLSWRVGIRNYEVRKGYMETNSYNLIYDTIQPKGWLTGNKNITYSYSVDANFVIALTKKIPLYIGVGVTRQKQFEEAIPFFNPAKTEWIINPHEVKFIPDFTAGVFIPLFNRVVLNLGYNYKPQTFFVGIAISGPYVYEDLDMW